MNKHMDQMKRIVIYIIVVMGPVAGYGQSTIDTLLAKIERNNTTLSAFRKNMEAEKIGNKTGIWPSNPEVEFNYLWGDPRSIGNRTDIAVSQSFDFPTAYKFRSCISEMKNKQTELEYQKKRLEILHHARILSGKLTYHNALMTEYKKRVFHAQQMAKSYRKKLESGEANLLDVNKSQINLLNVSKKLETIEIERSGLLSELAGLNGGIPIAFTDSVFAIPQVLSGFEQWYVQAEQNNPVLQWLDEEFAITNKQKQLQVAQSLPKISTGYMSEKVVGERF
jgi:outer membrane protein, heavy metal efflux system